MDRSYLCILKLALDLQFFGCFLNLFFGNKSKNLLVTENREYALLSYELLSFPFNFLKIILTYGNYADQYTDAENWFDFGRFGLGKKVC